MRSEPSEYRIEDDAARAPRAWRPRWMVVLVGAIALLLVVLVTGWLSRERIADNLISSEMEKRGIPAKYRIVSIGARRQVLEDLVIGDPNSPDFTAERVVVSIKPRLGVPDISSVRLVRPRIYGTYLDGKLSFGTLDPLIFTGSEEPFRLPDIDLDIQDGRALLESEFGAAGIKLDGAGNLRNGFRGKLAATAPGLSAGGCEAESLTLFGQLSVQGERPRFQGPLRLKELACRDAGIRLAKASLGTAVTADKLLDGAEGSLALEAGRLQANGSSLAGASGTSRFSWRKDRLTVRYDLQGRSLATSQVRSARIDLTGRLRAVEGLRRMDIETDASGTISSPGTPLLAAMDTVARQGEGTFVESLAERVRSALQSEASGATFSARITARRTTGGNSLVIPDGVVRGKSGAAMLSLSRVQLRTGAEGLQFISGNFMTGGPGLPRVSGSVRQGSGGGFTVSAKMADYEAGTASLAIPRLVVVQDRGGLGFSGNARISGPLPGGAADNISLPIDGNWNQSAGLSMWRSCADVSFDRLRIANLELSRRSLTVCPARGGAILRTGSEGLKIAAGVPALQLSGNLGSTPIRIASGAVGMAWPGNLSARSVDVALGPRGAASQFRIDRLSAKLGSEVAGSFEGADVRLDAVPLDLSEISGRWRLASGVLSLSQGALRVEDREAVDRFEPLVARDAALTLANNVITANATMREPQSDREVLRTVIRHDLATGRGSADIAVDALVFDDDLQPDTLTHLALGVIANAQGTVRGSGRIDWNDAGVTSTGRFQTESLDFAAAFGPVTGASGTIEFTDLLGLVTAPDQRLNVAAINPGIEVNDGVVVYSLLPGNILSLKRARWPFLDGTLRLRPVTIAFGSDEPVRYVLVIDGIDAARFVQQLDLGNLAATGTFDGRVPLVFDQDGGRIARGRLESRPPGGNVSYVGELTYEDLSPMANFAFDALRSIDYKQMLIQLEGPLDGEIVTRVTFDGIGQGEGAASNFVTRRIAKLPIRFRINVRAPFMQLVSSMRSLYDPEFIRDPRELGIVDGGDAAAAEASLPATKTDIQPSESDGMP